MAKVNQMELTGKIHSKVAYGLSAADMAMLAKLDFRLKVFLQSTDLVHPFMNFKLQFFVYGP